MARGRFGVYAWFVRLKSYIVQTFTAVALIIFLLWMSVFLYGTFCYIYMPTVSHEWRVHLRFRTDCDTDGRLCSFPTANLSLISLNQRPMLVLGQAYVVEIEMEMPESSVNQNLGMFMVQIQFYSRNGDIVFTSARSAMLQFKSFIHRTVETVFFLPSLLFRSFSQKQTVITELTNDYNEDPYRPTIGAVIEVQSKKVEIYSMILKIHAKFSGLRYFIYYWPTLSAIFGISSNFFFLSVVILFAWLGYMARSAGDLQQTTERKKSSESEHSLDSTEDDWHELEIPLKENNVSPVEMDLQSNEISNSSSVRKRKL